MGSNDYSEFFKDEPSAYIWLSPEQLLKSYTCVEIGGYPVAGQVRRVFWVASNGMRALIYRSTGMADLIHTSEFTVLSVVGATSTKNEDGRIKYLMDPCGEWLDLGPVSRHGANDSDGAFESVRRAHLRNKADAVDEEEEQHIRKAVKNDFWSKGGAF